MSSNPTSFRFPFATLADQPESVQQAHRAAFQGLDDLNQAVVALHKQVQAGVGGTTENVTNVQNTTINNSLTQTLGKVNNQTGVTSYTPTAADYGAFVILNDSSPIAVPLTGLNVLWYATFINLGTGAATITPASGTINGAASFALLGGNSASVAYDGTNYWASPPVPLPVNTLAVTSKWLTSYNSATGAFGQAQPAFTDISGTPSTTQVPFQSLTTTGAGAATLAAGVLNVPTPSLPLPGASSAIGGSVMTVGQTITTNVTVSGATTSMAVAVSPVTYPGAGFVWDAYVSAAGTVTVRLTCVLAGTPTSSVYNVRVLP